MKTHYRQTRHIETLFAHRDNRDEFVAALLMVVRLIRDSATQLALAGLFVAVWAVVFALALR